MRVPNKNSIQEIASLAEFKRIYATVTAGLAPLSANGSQCCLITSPSRFEGKTSVTSVLAVTAALQSRKKVLAVDFNWFKPALHEAFEVPLSLDLAQFLRDNDVKALIQPTGIPNLDIITAPSREQSAAISGTDATVTAISIIEGVREIYGQIFVDSCSIFPTNRYMLDPVVLSTAADSAIVVVAAGVTPKQQARRTTWMLQNAGANVLGSIVNQWKNPIQKS